MKLAISNIGFTQEDETVVYGLMKEYGYTGLEIAPTRILVERPYERIDEIKEWACDIKDSYGFDIPSMQSIWFGRTENIFESSKSRQNLLDYTKQAILFAEAIGCRNLVFGCPRNRNMPEGIRITAADDFFYELGQFACEHNTVIGMEANPPIYNTNYINDTIAAIELIERVASEGFKLNLDLGTMIHTGESVDTIKGRVKYVNHVHISEPGLKLIEKRRIHSELRGVLSQENYNGYISIEMGKDCGLEGVKNTMEYVREIFQ